MGGGQSILYAEPVTEKREGETSVYRYPAFKNGPVDAPEENLKTMKDILINSSKKYANRNALGTIVAK